MDGPRLAPPAPTLAEVAHDRAERERLHAEAVRLRARADAETAPRVVDRDAKPGKLPPGTAYFARFLRAGGTVDLASWRGILSQGERDALEAAGEIVARERAALVVNLLVDGAQVVATLEGDPLERAARAALRETGGAA